MRTGNNSLSDATVNNGDKKKAFREGTMDNTAKLHDDGNRQETATANETAAAKEKPVKKK